MRQLFLRHVAQTSPAPVGLEIVKAKGCYLYGADGKAYLDLIGGISVANIGHGNEQVIAAITKQANDYLHIMVYGELIQSPQVNYAQLLARHLPSSLDCVYFTPSGTEATEGAIKLARRATGRPEMVACHNSYHGSTTGALSLMGNEYWRNAFRPLMPGVKHEHYNSDALIKAITEQTACVVLETVQAEIGVQKPQAGWLKAVRQRCTEVGALLVLDEIQCGFGRTGSLWAFQQYGIEPDILLLGKALGGGMPLGAFVARRELMGLLSDNPVLGHITTFGGHPVSCAAGMAALGVLIEQEIVDQVEAKGRLLERLLVDHPAVKSIRRAGLLMASELADAPQVMDTLTRALDAGLFSDWFLFAPHCIRLAPPLTITEEEIQLAAQLLRSALP